MTTAPIVESTADVMRRVLADTPDVLAELERSHAAAWSSTDAELLDLCRLRIATMLGCDAERTPQVPTLDPALVDALADWPSSPLFDARHRAALAYTEHYVIDVASLDEGLVAALAEHLDPTELATFANALLVVEQRIRLRSMWDRLFDHDALEAS